MNKKQRLLVLFVLHILLIYSFSVTSQETTKSSYIYVGGDGDGNFSSINDAVKQSIDNTIIFVYNGTYNENIVINKSISIIGQSKNKTILNGNGSLYCINIINSNFIFITAFCMP